MQHMRRFRFAIFALLVWAAGPGGAQAQGWGFFDNLFGGGPRIIHVPQQGVAPRPRRRVQPKPAPLDTEDAGPKVTARKPGEPEPDHGIAVLGDNFAHPLANGLDEALAGRPDVAILHKARDSTGLTREGFFDWPKAIREFLDAKPAGARKIDAAVIMIGINDDRGIVEGGKTYGFGTPEWTAIFTRRVMEICDAFQAHKIPLIWVGMPIVDDDALADDLAAMNDIFRDAAAKTGATYVDTWEAFSDADGDFSATGPDVNGQIVRLRSSDGLRFTRAGSRKLAHFVEGDLVRILDETPAAAPAAIAGPAPAGAGDPRAAGPAAAKIPVKPDAGPVMVLNAPPVSATGRLEAAATAAAGLGDPLLDNALVKGAAQPPAPGRADNAAWPPRQ